MVQDYYLDCENCEITAHCNFAFFLHKCLLQTNLYISCAIAHYMNVFSDSLEFLYWFKAIFWLNILGFFPLEVKKIILHEVRFNPHENRLK